MLPIPASFGGAYRRELHAAIEAVRKASRLSSAIQSRLGRDEQVSKVDESPVTIADFGVQAVCTLLLKKAFPEYGWVAEEDSAFLRKPEGAGNLRKIADAVNEATEGAYSEAEVLDALDVGLGPGGATGRHWVLDPVDGTKGFIRGDQYAIALGLLDAGRVVLGILGCPNLPWNLEEAAAPRGCLLYGVRGEGSFQVALDGSRGPLRCQVSQVSEPAWVRVAESYEAAHSSFDVTGAIGRTLGTAIGPLRMDSQAKYGAPGGGGAGGALRRVVRDEPLAARDDGRHSRRPRHRAAAPPHGLAGQVRGAGAGRGGRVPALPQAGLPREHLGPLRRLPHHRGGRRGGHGRGGAPAGLLAGPEAVDGGDHGEQRGPAPARRRRRPQRPRRPVRARPDRPAPPAAALEPASGPRQAGVELQGWGRAEGGGGSSRGAAGGGNP